MCLPVTKALYIFRLCCLHFYKAGFSLLFNFEFDIAHAIIAVVCYLKQSYFYPDSFVALRTFFCKRMVLGHHIYCLLDFCTEYYCIDLHLTLFKKNLHFTFLSFDKKMQGRFNGKLATEIFLIIFLYKKRNNLYVSRTIDFF